MIKGINKQIIEIKCVNDEYFDKILLFVRADKAGVSESALKKGADNCCGRLLPDYHMKKRSGDAAKIALLALGAAAALGVMLYAIFVMM